MVEHHEQFLFVQSAEQTVERDEANFERGDALEPGQQDCFAALCRTAPVGLQSTVVLPDLVADVALAARCLSVEVWTSRSAFVSTGRVRRHRTDRRRR